MSTFLQLCQTVTRECGVTGSGPTNVETEVGMLKKLVNWVADADEYVQLLHADWNFLHVDDYAIATTTLGDATYAKPADHGEWDTESLYLDRTTDDYVHLMEIPYKEWRYTYRNGVKTNDQPWGFVIKPDNSLILEPPPDGNYALTGDYWMKATRMTVNASTSPVPTQYERIIIARAKIYYAEDEGAPEILVASQAEFMDMLEMLEKDELPGRNPYRLSDNPDDALTQRAE